MNSDNFLYYLPQLFESGDNYTPNPNPSPYDNMVIMPQDEDTDDTLYSGVYMFDPSDPISLAVKRLSIKDLPYDTDGLHISNGIGYERGFMIGEYIKYELNGESLEFVNNCKLRDDLKKKHF